MAKLSKRAQAIKSKVDRTKQYPFDQAISLIKECATAKFNESIESGDVRYRESCQ
jgi:large subunit ribosomal protein L1